MKELNTIWVLGDVILEAIEFPKPRKNGIVKVEYLGYPEWTRVLTRGGSWLLAKMIESAWTERTGYAKSICDDDDKLILSGVKPGKPPSLDAEHKRKMELLEKNRDVEILSFKYDFDDPRLTVAELVASKIPRLTKNLAVFPKSFERKDLKSIRIKEHFGWHETKFDGDTFDDDFEAWNIDRHKNYLEDLLSSKSSPELVAIVDQHNGFREALDNDILKEIFHPDLQAIVYQLYSPLGNNKLLDFLIAERKSLLKNSVAVVNDDCLSQSGIDVRFDISLETAAEDLLSQLEKSKRDGSFLFKLSQFRFLLIRFDYGVLCISRNSSNRSIRDIKYHILNFDQKETNRKNWGYVDARPAFL